MSDLKSNILFFLLIATMLLFASNVIADNHPQKKTKTYKVDFNNPEMHVKTLNNQQNKIRADDAVDPEVKILLFGKRHVLSLEPGAIKNTKIEYGETENLSPVNVVEPKNQDINK
ncbi:hypothetical protein JYT79_03425 [Cardiobacterium sp. AH-315-I02]|nr:hypothetical protein [Cardiobacterium sp. AH-315-I02]